MKYGERITWNSELKELSSFSWVSVGRGLKGKSRGEASSLLTVRCTKVVRKLLTQVALATSLVKELLSERNASQLLSRDTRVCAAALTSSNEKWLFSF